MCASGLVSTIRIWRLWRQLPCAHSRPLPICDQRQIEVDWPRLAGSMRFVPTISLDFSRSNASGRSDLHSPKDAWTCQTHASPGIRQDRCGTNAASPPFPPNGVSRLAATDGAVFRQQLEGVSWPRATFCIVDQDPRALHGPSDQQAPVFRQGSEGGTTRRVRRHAAGRRERTALLSGHGTAGPSSWQAGNACRRRRR